MDVTSNLTAKYHCLVIKRYWHRNKFTDRFNYGYELTIWSRRFIKLFCRTMSLLKTTEGVTSMESVRRGELVESTAGIEVVSSQVNTVEK